VSDAEVTLFRVPQGIVSAVNSLSVVSSTKTDALGGFRFRVDQAGSFVIRVRLEGYVGVGFPLLGRSDQIRVLVTAGNSQHVKLSLARPGELQGRFIDRESGNPIKDVSFHVMEVGYRNAHPVLFPAKIGSTGEDGSFVVRNLVPGNYVIVVNPKIANTGLISSLDADRDKTDEDWSDSIWPGGFGFESASPVTVLPGLPADIGTLPLQKLPYYRVQVSLSNAGCDKGEKFTVFRLEPGAIGKSNARKEGEVECGNNFLLRGFLPGTHSLELLPSAGTPVSKRLRALPTFEVGDRNLDVKAHLERGADLEVHIVTLDSADSIPTGLRISLLPLTALPVSDETPVTAPNADRSIRFENLPLGRKRINLQGLDGGHYLKDIRIQGRSVPGNIFDWTGEGVLEVVIDNKPSRVGGRIIDANNQGIAQAQVFLVSVPSFAEDIFYSVVRATSDDNGRFNLTGVAPGEYHILAISQGDADEIERPKVLERLLSKAESLTVSSRSSVDLSLKTTDPGR
jgi:hypothetical protein